MSTPFPVGRRTTARPPFKYAAQTRVSFSDTDAQGVVYYGRYMPYFDLARLEYHRDLGLIDIGFHEFVMRAIETEYHAPARFDDLLDVYVRVSRLGRSSSTYEFVALRARDDELLVTATQTLVRIDPDTRRPVPIASEAREPVRQFEGNDLLE
ncbi:MAG: acyl-CoA thioesterase [Gaiella sp.]